MFRILIVCTGNTCRSPMTEALLKDKIKQAGRAEDFLVLSAGLTGGGSCSASYGAAMAMMEKNIDLSDHMSRQFMPDYAEAAHLILAMTGSHKRVILQQLPQVWPKVYTLAEFAGETGDVDDPFGGDAEVYRQCANQIAMLVDKAWGKIVTLAGNHVDPAEHT